jgi:hypothetical protein
MAAKMKEKEKEAADKTARKVARAAVGTRRSQR